MTETTCTTPTVPPLMPARLPLMRPRRGRWLAGVCRGVSLHLGVHVAWVRLAFLACACWFGVGVLAYVALWVLVPAGDPYEEAARRWRERTGAPLARGNRPVEPPTAAQLRDYATLDYTDLRPVADSDAPPGETAGQFWRSAPKPALLAAAAVACFALAILAWRWQQADSIWLPVATMAVGAGLPWLRFKAPKGQLRMTVVGIALVFVGYTLLMARSVLMDGTVSFGRALAGGFGLLLGVTCALIPWIVGLVRRLGAERASKEREEERADMAAHLHDGVLQTLALIQLQANDPQRVFALARSQERELRSWLYQERTTSDRSVAAGLAQIAAEVEDTHGRPIDVVTVGDARPSAQTDALLDAATQAMVNAVTHGGEPVSVYCEAGDDVVEVFVRDHGEGFDTSHIPADRLGIRESIVGRMERRGGSVEIVSRAGWGTEVRMHMPITQTAQDTPAEHASGAAAANVQSQAPAAGSGR
ncbi:MAG: PspC domain-containing protein [Bifidobacterium sp.]|nr:PspC domain-containing protein [Bifidobacterium sp.]